MRRPAPCAWKLTCPMPTGRAHAGHVRERRISSAASRLGREVPAAALIFRASGTQVARVDANRKIHSANVTIACDDGTLVELASGASLATNYVEHQQPNCIRSNGGRQRTGGRPIPAREALNTVNAFRVIYLPLIIALTACAAGPNYRTPQPDEPPTFAADVALNSRQGSSTVPAAAPDLAVWWRALNDPQLNSLVDRAVKSNLDIEIALDRLQQARSYEAVVVDSYCRRSTRKRRSGPRHGQRPEPRPRATGAGVGG